MKRYAYFSFIVIAILLSSCAPKKIYSPVPSQQPQPVIKPDTGSELFSSAEKFFQERKYSDALDAFQNYISSFPNGAHKPDALLRMGEIYLMISRPSQAVSFYQLLITQYPGNSLVPAAQTGILTAWFNGGDYQKVIEQGQVFTKKNLPVNYYCKLFEIIADAYINLNTPVEAVYAYSKAWEKTAGGERIRLSKKIREPLQLISLSDLSALASRLGNSEIKADILFQIAQKSLEADNDEDAYNALTEISTKFSSSPPSVQASQMLQDLKKRADYEHRTIGCLLPLSGTYEIYGKKALKGIELAQSQFVSLHPDSALTIVIKDTGSDPEKTVLAVKEMAEAGVAAIIGPVATSDIAAEESQRNNIPIITLTQKDQITKTGNWVFRNFMTPDEQVKSLAAYTVTKLGLSRFAILYPNEPYGINFSKLFREQITSAGGQIVGSEMYEPSQTDFRDNLKKLTDRYSPDLPPRKVIRSPTQETSDPDTTSINEVYPADGFDALFIPDSPQKIAVIAPQLAYGNLHPSYLLGTNLLHSPKLIHTTGASIQGAILPDGFFAESISENVRQFVKTFQDTFKDSPGYIEAIAYDTAGMMFQIVCGHEIFFRSTIVKRLLDMPDYPGVTGNFHFNADREAQRKLYLLQIKDEQFIEIASP